MSGTAADPQSGVAAQRLYQPSFAAGELAPSLYWRSDLAKWRSALALSRNWYITPQGGAGRRAGTQFVGLAFSVTPPVRLIPFQFSTEQQYILEISVGVIRFISNGLYEGGNSYFVTAPFSANVVPALSYVQSADVMTFVHPSMQPVQLKRLGVANWTLSTLSIGTQLQAPSNFTATATHQTAVTGSPAPASQFYTYAVTAANDATSDESGLSNQAICSNLDLGYWPQYGYCNQLAWSAVSGAEYYKVYRFYQGTWSSIGSTVNTSFTDTNFVPNTADGPAGAANPFANGNWPAAVGYYQERAVFGGTNNNPETLYMSRSGNYLNFNVANPVRDDDAVTYTLAARQVNQVRHILPLADLIVMTGGGGWKVTSGTGAGAVTPNSIDVTPQSFVGASTVQPLIIGNRILYLEARGSSVREIFYQFVQNQYVSEDRSVLAKHLVHGYQIVSWAYAEVPDKVVWAVRNDGALLSLTYLPEQDVYAWAEHSTAEGSFLWVAVISESVNGDLPIDVPYFSVSRTINGVTYVTVERMWTRRLGPSDNDVHQAWYLDSALRYVGSPATVISGLTQFSPGNLVTYFADGTTGAAYVSATHTITLPTAASVVLVGLPIANQLQTLPAEGPMPASNSWAGRLKQSFRTRIAVENAVSLTVSIDGNGAEPLIDAETGAAPTGLVTQVLETRTTEGWSRPGQVSIVAPSPLPATVLGIVHEWMVGE